MGERLDVLVIHGMPELASERRTKIRHLFALQRYARNHRFVYHYFKDPVSDALRSIRFGAVVLDCNFLGWRWSRPRQILLDIKDRYSWLRDYGAIIAAFPQDDFDHARYLDEWLAEIGTNVLFSVYRHHWDVLYPRLIAGGAEIVASYAGYVDDDDVTEYRAARKPFRERSIDVGYRVNRLPANFGRFGVLKSEFGRAFARAARGRARCDISDAPEDTVYGQQWPRFLGESKFTLGSEAGSSVLDPTGEIQDRVQAFAQENPTASFEESWSACVRPQDEGWTFPATSPRIFETAMAGSCPILLEGDYDGLIAPDQHFISVRRDFSNIESAVDRLTDLDAAEAIAARFEEAILGNPALRYKRWVETVIVPKLLELGAARSDPLSDWEFAFRLEQHRSAAGQARAEQIAALELEVQALKNSANVERLRLHEALEQPRRLIDRLRTARRPVWRAIASRLRFKMLAR